MVLQNVGKYAGYEFEDILQMDLPYCEFMLSLKFVKKENQKLIDFLKENIEQRRRQAHDEAVQRLKF